MTSTTSTPPSALRSTAGDTMQQRVNKPRPLKRMDECAREQEQRDHQEMLSRARRASNKAKRTSAMAEALLSEIKDVL